MKRAIWLTLLGVCAFAAIVVARAPASWAIPSSADIACTEVDGTVWNGTCAGLVAFHQPVGDLSWTVNASRLLAGKLNADVTLTRAATSARGNIEMGLNKIVTARNVQADFPIDPSLSPQIPRDLHGSIHAELALLQLSGPAIKGIQGRIEARNIEEGVAGSTKQWGSYSLTFPATPVTGVPVGQLRDLGGPLAVEGTLRLTPEPGYDLQGMVAARSTAPPELAQDLRYLGSPDARGMRPFGFSGTF